MEMAPQKPHDLEIISSAGSGGGPSEHWVEDEASSMSTDDDISVLTPRRRKKRASQNQLVQKETAAVNLSKSIVYLVLIFATAALATVTYVIAVSEEKTDYEREFVDAAYKIVDAAEADARLIVQQTRGLSTSVTSSALTYNWTWPLTTLPDFAMRNLGRQQTSGAETIIYSPVVMKDSVDEWEKYAWLNQGWIASDIAFLGLDYDPGAISPIIYPWPQTAASRLLAEPHNRTFRVPVWQVSPPPRNASIVNLDLESQSTFEQMIESVLELRHVLLSGVADLSILGNDQEYTESGQPRAFMLEPVFGNFFNTSTIAGFVTGVLQWKMIFSDGLPKGTPPIIIDVSDSCGSAFTYVVKGPLATFHLPEDKLATLRHPKYDYLTQTFTFGEGEIFLGGECTYLLSISATLVFEATFRTDVPDSYSALVFFAMLFSLVVFAVYDCQVQRRQRKALGTAQRTTAIVTSLFPQNVHERILLEAEHTKSKSKGSAKIQLKEFLDDADRQSTMPSKTKPIADFFPEVTIMFADLVGFTAWSSMREPAHVFTLLESVFRAFDEIATRRRVFKVETVGDCYVAVVGLPEPRKDHAVVMARFARDCLSKLYTVVKELGSTLGPDTADLGMRFGLHSGPVTAGVLRGERARFQLFGDSMNTTARIEATGKRNRIHISSEMAKVLIDAGKQHWIRPREDKIVAKGKGELSTFWLEAHSDMPAKSQTTHRYSVSDTSFGMDNDDSFAMDEYESNKLSEPPAQGPTDDQNDRLVDWVKELMMGYLKEIASVREASSVAPDLEAQLQKAEQRRKERRNGLSISEVAEVIDLPDSSTQAYPAQYSEDLDEAVVSQLRDYISTIAAMYNDHSFHSFPHVAHVTMSVVKLFSRITAPDPDEPLTELNEYTYGIASDPLTKFAVLFSALVHDVDHPGVPNAQLIKEKSPMADYYKGKSVAEQNSVDLAWDLLMDNNYLHLRRAIYCTVDEFTRFRQLVVNTVLATDIMDKGLGALRKERWDKAFSGTADDDHHTAVNRRVTIVIEHLMQASDVAHTMQHWHIYRKWNARLFMEMRRAYNDGRSEKDPADFWYKGEIGFFDFYIIPLAKKLKDCGVFGVSSDEYLNYATQNRKEWELKGEGIVEEMLEEMSTEEIFL